MKYEDFCIQLRRLSTLSPFQILDSPLLYSTYSFQKDEYTIDCYILYDTQIYKCPIFYFTVLNQETGKLITSWNDWMYWLEKYVYQVAGNSRAGLAKNVCTSSNDVDTFREKVASGSIVLHQCQINTWHGSNQSKYSTTEKIEQTVETMEEFVEDLSVIDDCITYTVENDNCLKLGVDTFGKMNKLDTIDAIDAINTLDTMETLGKTIDTNESKETIGANKKKRLIDTKETMNAINKMDDMDPVEEEESTENLITKLNISVSKWNIETSASESRNSPPHSYSHSSNSEILDIINPRMQFKMVACPMPRPGGFWWMLHPCRTQMIMEFSQNDLFFWLSAILRELHLQPSWLVETGKRWVNSK